MRFLFVHQNFPGQFRHVLAALVANPQHQVVGIGEAGNVSRNVIHTPGLKVHGYAAPDAPATGAHLYLRSLDGEVRRGQQVFRSAHRIKSQGFDPDVVVVHPGWGEALFLRELFPRARHIHYCEYFYHADGADLGYDPEFPATLDERMASQFKNSSQLLGLLHCDAACSPTAWQRERYPAQLRDKIQVMHEGVDSTRFQPDAQAVFEVDGLQLRFGDPIVTYAARNLEPYRGFHQFMRSLPMMQAEHPDARFVIAGGDGVSYGKKPADGGTYRALYCAELGDQVDWSRVHFTGRLPLSRYIQLLQVSAAHVYLTYPFVLSWSLLEAMSCASLVITADTAPVREVVTDGVNGLLVDFFDREKLARTVSGALRHPADFSQLRHNAREHIRNAFDLHTRCLPAWMHFLEAA